MTKFRRKKYSVVDFLYVSMLLASNHCRKCGGIHNPPNACGVFISRTRKRKLNKRKLVESKKRSSFLAPKVFRARK